MKIVDRGTVFRGEAGGPHQSAFGPYLAVLPSGRWLCSFRTATKKELAVGTQTFCWSDDQGRSWSPPHRPFGPVKVDGRPGDFRTTAVSAGPAGEALAALMWVDQTDPSLPLFNPQTQGVLYAQTFWSRSLDEGQTWSPPLRIDTRQWPVPVAITGPILTLKTGELACSMELCQPYTGGSDAWHSSVLAISSDEGNTWPHHVTICHDSAGRMFWWDQRLAVLDDGTLLDLFWTYDNKAGRYLNVHAAAGSPDGRRWSALWDTGVPDQPAPPVSLPDGRIAMVYVDRTGAPAVKLRVSADGARTFPADTELQLYSAAGASQTVKKSGMSEAWSEMGAFSVGLPSTTRTADGDVLIVYYAGPQTDQTGIEWVRVRA